MWLSSSNPGEVQLFAGQLTDQVKISGHRPTAAGHTDKNCKTGQLRPNHVVIQTCTLLWTCQYIITLGLASQLLQSCNLTPRYVRSYSPELKGNPEEIRSGFPGASFSLTNQCLTIQADELQNNNFGLYCGTFNIELLSSLSI